jgi:hypothetical protein
MKSFWMWFPLLHFLFFTVMLMCSKWMVNERVSAYKTYDKLSTKFIYVGLYGNI